MNSKNTVKSWNNDCSVGYNYTTIASSMESGNHNNSLWTVSNTNSKYSDTYGSSWRSKAYGTKSTSESILLSTGASETFCKQGIYDLAGNLDEWTLEYTSFTSSPCTSFVYKFRVFIKKLRFI